MRFLLLLVFASCLAANAKNQTYTDDFFVAFTTGNVTFVQFAQDEDGQESGDSTRRLPDTLKPIHYLIRLQPFINGNMSVNGYVEITFEVKEDTSKIILHLTDIITQNDTTKVSSINAPDKSIDIKKQEYDHVREFYTATLTEQLKKGETYMISMTFEGFLNDKMVGFYRSSYKDEEGNKKLLASTQFEPTDARRAFPCFDEPDFKAKFSIEIAREKGMNCISNMPLAESVPFEGNEGWFWDRFNTTLPMSTYLVAFIVSDFDYVEADDTDTYKFRVYARKNAISSAKYAVDLGFKVSKYFEDFFNVSFPLPKQDMAAIPDFSSGGMENWGLVTYRETAILYDAKVAKAEDKFRVASVVSHELAHQWFGDLVTPEWWNDLWLNEGFASYMEYVGLRETESEMNPMDQILVRDLHEAFTLDALESSHPVSAKVGNPNEISSIFDSISYSKGASIIRMMSGFLTEQTFQKALTKYLTELSYSNAEQDDLWRYLTDQAHADGTLKNDITVKDIMDTWTVQMGYPLLTVKREKDGTATITQERFLLVKSQTENKASNTFRWWIPITFTSKSEANFNDTLPKEWMKPTEASKVISGMPSAEEWVIFNVGLYGFYRVNYEEDNWAMILKQMKTDPTQISESNRVQIIDDSAHLARIGKLPYDTFLSLMTYLKNEQDLIPITAALNNLAYISDMLSSSSGYGYLQNYILSLILPLYEDVGFEDSSSDAYLTQIKRVDILKWACDLGHEPCIEKSVDLYDKWMESPEDDTIISPNLKPIVYCTAIREGGVEEWEFAWERYTKSNIASEQKELLQAMGCTNVIWILEEYLNRSMSSDQGIKKQMIRYIIPAIGQSPTGRYVAWHFLRNRWLDFVDYFGNQNFIYDEIIKGVTQALNTNIQLEEMKWFMKTYDGKFSSGEASVKQAAEYLQSNVSWMNNFKEIIVQWLKTNGYKSDI